MRKMRRLMKSLRRGQKGFTLIELLIVVAILGILAAVIIPNVSTFMSTGTLNAARTEAENVKTASLAFYADNSVWPDTSGDLESPIDYIQGTLRGTYAFDDNGQITASGTSWDDASLTWDETGQTWEKATS